MAICRLVFLFTKSTLARCFTYCVATVAIVASMPAFSMYWTTSGNNGYPVTNHTATLLLSGKVLVAGGDPYNGAGTNSVQLFDPVTMRWSVAPNLGVARRNHTSTLLSSGRVFVVGGAGSGATTSSELFDPASLTWSAGPALSVPRNSHRASRLDDGRVIVVGGFEGGGSTATASAEIYDPATATWSLASAMSTARAPAGAFALGGNRVLVLGTNGSTEIYDVATNAWSVGASAPAPGFAPSAMVLSDGRILLLGAGIYDPVTALWTSVAASPESFRSGAPIGGSRAVFTGRKQVPCTPNLFCDVTFSYEFDAVTNTWLYLDATYAGALGISIGGQRAFFSGPVTGNPAPALVYQPSAPLLGITDTAALPLNPAVGATYLVSTLFSPGYDIVGRAPTGTIAISDGSATCNIMLPASSCSLTTAIAGAKTITATYLGDRIFLGATAGFEVKPTLYVVRQGGVNVVTSTPNGILCVPVSCPLLAYPFPAGTLITLTAGSTDPGQLFVGWLGDCAGRETTCTLTMPAHRNVVAHAYSVPTSYAPLSVDVDRDGTYRATSDALALLRFMQGMGDAAIAANALNAAAPGLPLGLTPAAYYASIKPVLDIDGNGVVDVATDGVLLGRYLSGFRGQSLIAGALGVGATRISASAVGSYIQSMMP